MTAFVIQLLCCCCNYVTIIFNVQCRHSTHLRSAQVTFGGSHTSSSQNHLLRLDPCETAATRSPEGSTAEREYDILSLSPSRHALSQTHTEKEDDG